MMMRPCCCELELPRKDVCSICPAGMSLVQLLSLASATYFAPAQPWTQRCCNPLFRV